MLAQALEGNSFLTKVNLSSNYLADEDIDHLGRILATCRLEKLDLSDNIITLSGFVCLTQNVPKCLKSFHLAENDFSKEEAACHILALFQEHPQLWHDGFDWEDSESPMHQKIQHFKDLNRCGRILLLARDGAIPLSVWPIVLARANTLLKGFRSKERTPDAIFPLLQGPALMQRRFARDANDAPFAKAGKRATRYSKRLASADTEKANAKTAKKRKVE
jgi:hypothetical protein